MKYLVIEAASLEPVSLALAKQQVRKDEDDEDEFISHLITTAREACENFTGLVLASQTVEVAFWHLPSNPLTFGFGPVTEVVSVKYFDANNAEQDLSAESYRLNQYVAPEQLIFDEPALPELADRFDAVKIRVKAGNDGACPAAIKQAILLYVGHYYENREASINTGNNAAELPLGAQHLLQPYRVNMGV